MIFLKLLKDSYDNSRLKIYSIISAIIIIAISEIWLVSTKIKYANPMSLVGLLIETYLIVSLFFLRNSDNKNKYIRNLRKLNSDLIKKESSFRKALSNFNDVFWEYSMETKELKLSEKWTDVTGYMDYKICDIDLFINKLIHPEDMDLLKNSSKEYFNNKTPFLECNFRILDNKNIYRWVYLKGIYQDENVVSKSLIGFLSDITSRKNIEEKLNYLAYYDALTGLPNKMLFLKHLKESVDNSTKNNTSGALIFLDIDDFKNVNDTLGHDYGDQLLKIISELLKLTLGDERIVSRIGGDEFSILIEKFDNKGELENICHNIRNLFMDPFEIGDKVIYSTVSIGVTMYPRDNTDLNELLKNADTAMYKSKDSGKNKYCFFDANMGSELERKIKIGNLLRQEAVIKELSLVYQPQYSIKTGKIVSIEALIRWKNKELGYVSPSEFIPIAESNGTINSIGKWVFQEICKQNREWKDKGYCYDSIAVNISTIQIQDAKLVAYIMEAIEKNGVEPSTIEIEITETLLMNNISLNKRKLHEIRRLGVKIAIDDFGTGYSSLNYLTYLPLDTLKIDKAFIDNITNIDNDRILAKNIIKLSHDLDIKVVAEGVENREQLDILNNINCDIIQGYYFSKPLLKEEIELKFIEFDNGGDDNGGREAVYLQ